MEVPGGKNTLNCRMTTWLVTIVFPNLSLDHSGHAKHIYVNVVSDKN